MKAAWYERAGPPHDVLQFGDMELPEPQPSELTIRVHVSGVNPGDVKKRQDAFALGLPFPRIVPHSDGAGVVEQVGAGVPSDWLGRRVWCFGAQTYRPFGTAAELCNVPLENVTQLPDGVIFEQGALLGIPGLTAYAAVHAAGSPAGKTVLVQGGTGAVGSIAVRLAKRASARVIAVVRRETDEAVAREAGADEVVLSDGKAEERILELAPQGVDHVAEVVFAANIDLDTRILAQGGSIAVYSTDAPVASVSAWPLVFKNANLRFVGSDDLAPGLKQAAARELTAAASEQWLGLPVVATYSLTETADAHERVEQGGSGRVVVQLATEA